MLIDDWVFLNSLSFIKLRKIRAGMALNPKIFTS